MGSVQLVVSIEGAGSTSGEVVAIAGEGDYCAARLRVEGLPGPLMV